MKNWGIGTKIFNLKRWLIFHWKTDFLCNTWKSCFWLPKLTNSYYGQNLLPLSTTSIDQNWIRETMRSENEIYTKMTFSWFQGWNSYFIHQFWNFRCFCLHRADGSQKSLRGPLLMDLENFGGASALLCIDFPRLWGGQWPPWPPRFRRPCYILV